MYMAIHLPLSLLYNLPEGIFMPLASTNRRNTSLVGKQKYGWTRVYKSKLSVTYM